MRRQQPTKLNYEQIDQSPSIQSKAHSVSEFNSLVNRQRGAVNHVSRPENTSQWD